MQGIQSNMIPAAHIEARETHGMPWINNNNIGLLDLGGNSTRPSSASSNSTPRTIEILQAEY